MNLQRLSWTVLAAGAPLALAAFAPSAAAGSIELPGLSGGSWSVPIRSIKEARYRAVVPQKYDFSCGSAALATLLTYHYQHPVSEEDVFVAMYERGDQKKIQRYGFSLLDIKNYLETEGYRADGVQASLAELAAVGIPAIALIKENGYSHFVVVKGIRDGEVLVGDPAKGSKVFSQATFETLWTNGILFVIRNRIPLGKQRFNPQQEWNDNPRAPLSLALNRDSLAAITLLRPPRSDF
jgi:predicted double-glycine peptidase